jgi:glutamate racemase
VETLQVDGPEFLAELRGTVEPLLAHQVDRIVLGCTHYSFLVPLLQPLVAGRAELVDVAAAVARQVLRLRGTDAAAGCGRLTLLATARPERLQAALPALGLGWLAQRAHAAAQHATI